MTMSTTSPADDHDPFASGTIALTASVTEPQQEIWLAIALLGEEANLAYNESVSLAIRGPLDAAVLEQAVADLVRRHEALRTTFTSDGTQYLVEAEPRAKLSVLDISGLAPEAREAKRKEIVGGQVRLPFDLVRGPLFRPLLIRLEAEQHELVLTAHHIVCDGWSTGVVLTELAELYAARKDGRAPKLAPAPLFSEFAMAELRAMHGEDAAAAEKYWVGILGAAPSALELPIDRPRSRELKLDARREDWLFDRALVDGLRCVAKQASSTLVATLMAAVDAWLFRLTGQTDFAMGLPAAGQAAVGMPGLVGHCVNTLPLRVTLNPEAPFLDHVRAVKGQILEGAEHQRLSFGALLKKLEVPRDPARIPLIPVIFNLDQRMPAVKLGGATGSFISNPRAFERFELFFNGTETDEGLILETTYNTHLFDHQTILRWLRELTTLLQAVVAAPNTPLGKLRVLPDDEQACLLTGWNATERELPAATNAIDLIEAQVRRTPDTVAVRDDRGSLTYAELDKRANHIAHKLKEMGVGKDDCVGVCMERSTRLPVALLGVWKADAAYVPLDPDYPPARLAFVVDDAKIKVLITEHSLAEVFPQDSFVRLWIDEENDVRQDAPKRQSEPHQLAYVLHTSGSTGKPKGVQVEQLGVVNFLASASRVPGLSASDVLVAVTTLSFDIAALELFLPLCVGSRTVIASREVAMDGPALAKFLHDVGATVLQATPATWRLLCEANFVADENFKAMSTGEALPRELANDLMGRVGSLWNLYGPTETTIWSTCGRIDTTEGPITIGRPVDNTTVYLLDPAGQMVPTGAAGELYIGGAGVGRGYLNRADLTDERFLPDPFSTAPGARMYKTGDLVRWSGDGRLFFERRNDGQVKVRGFRIELAEIEGALDQHPSVRQSAVLVREIISGDVRLVAYVVPAFGQTVDASALTKHVRDRLPPYMIPQHLVVLETMPLTPNGKVDRKSLPTTELGSNAGVEDYVAPVTPVQVQMAAMWADLLRVGRVGLRDGFFALGGHSMLAVRMLNRLRETFGAEIPLRTVFRAQTIEELSAHVEAALLVGRGGEDSPRAAGETEEVDF
jgi:amino acid adenylation domain-containing protein